MTVHEVWRALRKRWKLILATMLAVLAVTAALTVRQTPLYSASARYYFSAEAPADGRGGGNVVSANDLNTYAAVMGSPTVLDPLRKTLGLPADYPVQVQADVSDNASILVITAQDSTPSRARDIANRSGQELANASKVFSPLLAQSGQAVRATTISPAATPDTPTSPRTVRNLVLAALAGLLLGIGLALMRHTFDTRLRTDEDLAEISDAPVLARLPLDKDLKETGTVKSRGWTAYGEGLRRLRSNLQFVDATTQGNSFVVTSPSQSEGKTTTSVNLAMALAQAGVKTLLIDGDLRRSAVAERLGLEGVAGLTTVLVAQAAPEDVIQPYGDSGLDVLCAGEVPPNPSELLGSPRMAKLFNHLSSTYDLILIDSPPVLPVVDAILLQRLAGGLVMVVAADTTRKRDLQHAVKLLETAGIESSGFVVNLVTKGSAASGYERYGYGYSKDGEKERRRSERAAEKPSSPRSSRRKVNS